MLVLSRKQKQQIRIGDNVVITVLQIKGGSVRIGIEAPREVHVMRGELEDFGDSKSVPSESGKTLRAIASAEAEEPADILAMTAPGDNSDQQDTSQTDSKQRILELKFQGGTDDESQPTRLSQIAGSIPSLNLPR